MAGEGKYQLGVQIVGDIAASFGTSMSKAEKEIKALYRTGQRSTTGMVKGINTLSGMSDKVFSAVAKGAGLAAVGMAGIAAASTMVGANFEAQMSTVQSISGATSGELEQLTNAAKEMGRTTQFSATESGKAMEYMAMAGWETQDMIDGLPGIMNLAAASGEELGLVSDIVTDALTAFGMTAKDSGKFADVLAQASSSTNTNVAMMGETFKYVAPVAGSFGYTIEDTALAIGLMANSGIKASQAGTSLRRILLSLGDGATLSGKAFGEMEIKTANADGSMRDLRVVLGELRTGFSQLTDEEKAANAEAIAGKTGIAGLLAIMNASEEDFQELTVAIDESAGAAEHMAGIRIDNLQGDVKLLASAAEGAGIAIYKGLSDPLREVTKLATQWIQSFVESDWLESFTTEGIPTARRNLIQLGKSFEPLINVGKWLMKNSKAVTSSLVGIGAALLTFKAAKGITTIVKTLGALSGIMGAWPVLAVGAVIGLIAGIGTAIAQTEKEAAEADLAARFGDIALSMKDLDEVARSIVGKNLLDGIDMFHEASGKTSELYKSLKSSVEEINKENWKLSLGIEFTEDDTKSYVASVESYVETAQDYIQSNGYEVKLAAAIVFGDSQSGKEFQESNDAFVSSLMAQVEPIKQDIADVLAQITEEGLTLPKQELLNGYLAEMSELTQMITDAQNSADIQMIKDEYKGLENLTPESFQNLQQSTGEYTQKALVGVDEAYKDVLTQYNAQRIAGEQGKEGGITQEEYEVKAEAARLSALDAKTKTVADAQKIQTDVINSIYSYETITASGNLDETMMRAMETLKNQSSIGGNGALAWDTDLFQQGLGIPELDKESITNMATLWENMQPQYQELQDLALCYLEAGKAIPQALSDGLADASMIGAIAGDQEAIWQLMAGKVDDSPEYRQIIEDARAAGYEIPEEIAAYLDSNAEAVEPGIEKLYELTQKKLDERFQNIAVNGQVNFNLVGKFGEAPLLNPASNPGSPALSKNGVIGKRAKGGIVTSPEISWIAEAGYSEAVIPLDGSQNATELWKETGRLMGEYEARKPATLLSMMSDPAPERSEISRQSNQSSVPPFAPVVNIYGNTSEASVENALSATFEQFKDWYVRLKTEEARVSW